MVNGEVRNGNQVINYGNGDIGEKEHRKVKRSENHNR